MKKLLLAAAMAASGMAVAQASDYGSNYLREERRQPNRPAPSRDKRKKLARRPLSGRPEKVAARAYVAHELGDRDEDGLRSLCGRKYLTAKGRHRQAIGEKIMCNDCQRTRWALDRRAR